MKKERKEKSSGNKQGQKRTLTEDDLKVCEEFTECRLSRRMNQKQWAEAVGISYGLVKRIEARTIACSKKTMTQVRQFMDSCDACPDTPDLHELEEHVLYDIFLTNMRQLSKKEAAEYAGKCTRSLRDTLSGASRCNTPDAQKKYFEFVDMFLKALSLTSVSSVDAANRGLDLPVITDEIVSFTNKKISKSTSPADTARPENKAENFQMSLLDGFLDQEI